MTIPSPHAQAAWADLTEMYGARWLKERGRVPTSAWCVTLDLIKGDAMKRVMQAVRNKHSTHPITLTDFQKLAKGVAEQVADATFLRRYWASTTIDTVESTGALDMFSGKQLWPRGHHLSARQDGDTRVVQGTLGVAVRDLTRRLIDKYSQLDTGLMDRGELIVRMRDEATEGLRLIAGQTYTR